MTGPLFAVFSVLAVATVGLALYRMLIVRFKADESLHLMDSAVAVIEGQKIAAHRLGVVDTWGKSLTILTLLSGIAAYCAWILGA